MTRFFTNCDTLESLKAEYKRLAMQFHPDRAGGDLETMQAINAEYDELFEHLKMWHRNVKGERYEKDVTESPDEFKDIVNVLIRIPNITIEIIGTFIWIHGLTEPHEDTLKKLGFRKHFEKKCWYRSPAGYRRKTKRNMSMDEIRDSFGVKYSARTGNGASNTMLTR